MTPGLKWAEFHVVVATTLAVTQFTALSLGVNITVNQWRPCRQSRHQLDQSKKFYFFLKNRRDFIGAKHTPGCAFLFFLLTERWHSAMFVAGRHNAKVYTLRSRPAKIVWRRKTEQVCCSRSLLFSPAFFPTVFILFRTKWCCFFFAVVVCCHFGRVCLAVTERFCLPWCYCVRVFGLQTQ